MYAKKRIGLIIPARHLGNGGKKTIPQITRFIDRVYVMDYGSNGDFDALKETFASDERIEFVESGEKDEGVFPEPGLSRAIQDAMDISVVVDEDKGTDPTLLSHILDPIIWGMADYTIGRQVPNHRGNNGNGSTHSSNYIQITQLTQKNVGGLDFSNKLSAISNRSFRDNGSSVRISPPVIAAIPCYNEGVTIGSVALQARKHVDEVVVIDDGSIDDTALIAVEAGATVISHGKNRGKAAAIATAVQYAKNHSAEALILLDGDGQHDPEEIPTLLSPIKEGKADFVIGSRHLGQKNHIPRYRKVGQKILTLLTNAMSHQNVTDSQSGFRAFSGKAIQIYDVKSEGFNIETDMINEFSRLNIDIKEVPIAAIYDVPHKHTLNPIYHGHDIVSKLIGEIAYRRPLLLFSASGGFLVLVGIGAASWAFTSYYLTGRLSFLFTMASGILIIMGTLLLVAGLILNSLIFIVKQKS